MTIDHYLASLPKFIDQLDYTSHMMKLQDEVISRHPVGEAKNAAKYATMHRTAFPQQRVILLQMPVMWKSKNPGLSNSSKLAM